MSRRRSLPYIYMPSADRQPMQAHSTPGGSSLEASRPASTYGVAHAFTIKLWGLTEPLVFVMGETIPDLRWKMRDKKLGNWKNIRAGDIILFQQPNGDLRQYFAEWVRLDRGDPNTNDGDIVDSVARWERTVKLTTDSPCDWWGDLGPVVIP